MISPVFMVYLVGAIFTAALMLRGSAMLGLDKQRAFGIAGLMAVFWPLTLLILAIAARLDK